MIRFPSVARLASVFVLVPVAMVLAVPGSASADEKAGDGIAKSEARATSGRSMNVKRLVLAHGVGGHEPQEAGTRFATKDDRVYAFVEVENPGGDDSVAVVFEPPTGPAFAAIPLKVAGGAAHFRTWAFTRRAHDAGEWAVVVRDTHGKLLARQSFTVTK